MIVAGMHRSGTSVLTNVLALYGCSLPAKLNLASEDNPRGSLEPEEIVQLNDAMLARMDSAWDDWASLPQPWFASAEAAEFVQRAIAIIVDNYGDSQRFVLKDPRICRLLPIYRSALTADDREVKVILALRHPAEVVQSLWRRDRLPRETSLLLWLRHVLEAEHHSRGLSRVFIQYAALMEQPEAVIDTIEHWLNLTLPRRTAQTRLEVQKSLMPELRHNLAEDLDVQDPMGWAARVQDALGLLVADPDHADAMAQCDTVVAEMDRLCAMFEVPHRHIRMLREQADANSSELAARLEERDRDVIALNDRTRQLVAKIDARDDRIAELQAEMASILQSTSWKLTLPLRYLGYRSPRLARLSPRALMEAWRSRGYGSGASVSVEPPVEPYQAWLEVNGACETSARRLASALAEAGDALPLISVVMPVYKPPLDYLEAAVESVLTQGYSRWELCIHVDGDDGAELHRWLGALQARESRIRLSVGETNGGISLATNAAAALASGEYLAFLDQDDLLHPDALAQIALAAAREPDLDLLYSDDDKVDRKDLRFAPQFKPDWAPVLLLSYMYMSHLLVARRALFRQLGGFRKGFEGSQDYDFALRASEQARRVVHIPEVLYHWRALPGSTATSGDAKPASFTVGLQAVQEACERRGVPATAYQPDWAKAGKLGVFSLRFPDSGPHVTIIIPTRDRIDLLRPCVESIERLTSYDNYSILVLDNESDDPDTLQYLRTCGHRVIRLTCPNDRFSFSYLMNRGVEHTDSEYVLLLNNDTEVRRADWLSQMVGYACMAGVGAVGAKLHFPDNSIQHAGVLHGMYGDLPGPAFRNVPSGDHGYLSYLMVAREYSAVTAACLLTPRALFLELGGMDEEHFAVAYNDVDYCYRVVESGGNCVYCPEAELTHYEGKSRGFLDNPLEIASFRDRYRDFRDRWYNPNLAPSYPSYSIRPWRHVAPELRHEPTRVVMVSNNFNHEGAPNCMFELARGLKASGVVDPVVLTPVDGPLRRDYEDAAVPIRIIDHPLKNAFEQRAYGRNVASLAEALRLAGAEMVFANTADAFWAIDAARLAGLPTVWNIHESEPWDQYYQGLPEFLQVRALAMFRQAYRVVFVAESTCEGWLPLNSRSNFAVIPYGLDLERMQQRIAGLTRQTARDSLDLAEGEIVLVLVGTVCERKNQRVLLQALPRLSEEMAARVRVFLVGDRDGPYSQQLHADHAALPSAWRERVEIVAETDQPYRYFLAGDIAICTSRLESYPRVVIEAMALGLPVVTTPVFGIRQQVHEYYNGLFFRPEAADELADALTTLIQHDRQRAEMGTNSARLFRGLMQYDQMLLRYGAVIREAALSSPPGLPIL